MHIQWVRREEACGEKSRQCEVIGDYILWES